MSPIFLGLVKVEVASVSFHKKIFHAPKRLACAKACSTRCCKVKMFVMLANFKDLSKGLLEESPRII